MNNIPWLKNIFPEFWVFLIIGGIIGFPTCLAIGQIYIKSELNKASTRTNPFSTHLVPTQFIIYQAQANMCRALGLEDDAQALDKLVAESRKKW